MYWPWVTVTSPFTSWYQVMVTLMEENNPTFTASSLRQLKSLLIGDNIWNIRSYTGNNHPTHNLHSSLATASSLLDRKTGTAINYLLFIPQAYYSISWWN